MIPLSLLALAAVTYHLPFYAVGPGPAYRVDALIRIPKERAFANRGEFLLTSVSIRDVTAFEAVRARFNPDIDLVPVAEVLEAPPSEANRRRFETSQRSTMQRSQHVAVRVAFARLGLALPEPGDPAGDIAIDVQGVGGASGGLALTLGLIDLLSSGHLSGGHRVAVTGTIAPNGFVGDVDGVAQKTAAARAAGAEYILVPPANYDTAVAHAGKKLKVLKAASIDEALTALARIGGEVGLPR